MFLELDHLLRRGNELVEVDLSLTYLFENFISAYNVGACSKRLFMQCQVSENAYSQTFSSACRQYASASDVLVSLCRIDIELNKQLERLIKLSLLANFYHFSKDLLNFKVLTLKSIHHRANSTLCRGTRIS